MGRLFQMVGGDYLCSICGTQHSSAAEACPGPSKKDKSEKSEIAVYMEELRQKAMEELRQKAIEKDRKKISGEDC